MHSKRETDYGDGDDDNNHTDDDDKKYICHLCLRIECCIRIDLNADETG